LRLVLYPDPVLRRRAVPLETIDDSVRDRVREMFETMYEERGVGLAAPQVGWSVRLFIVNTSAEPDEPELDRVYINPQLSRPTEDDDATDTDEEGCLSIPGVRGKVLRPDRVVVRALDLDGKPFEEEVDGLHARVVQHEFDHLDGILFISRLSATERLLANKILKQLEREYKRG
jgi:peptide deformylase